MTIADDLTSINTIKQNIKQSIIDKGVSVTGDFSTYSTKISEIQSGSSEEYIRPADWLTLPTLVEGDQKVVALNAVFDAENNFIAFKVQGNYTVDWGDGIIENFASGVKAEHNYNYSAINANTLTERGYKQVIITITPQAGQNLTVIDFNARHSTLLSVSSSSLLDFKVVGSNISSLTFSAQTSNIWHLLIESFSFIGTNVITDGTYMFNGFNSLAKVDSLYTGNMSLMRNMFAGCKKLKIIPSLNTTNATNLISLFVGCSSIINIPSFNTANVTDFTNIFNSCGSLLKLPFLNVSKSTTFLSAVGGCYALQVGALNGTAKTISYSGLNLSRTALIDIFNGLASGVTGQTLTITGNYGVASLTVDDKAIATGKGWTLVL